MIKLKDLLNEAKPVVVGNVNAFGPSKVLGKGGKVLGFVPDTPNAIATLIQDYPNVQAIEFKSPFFFDFKSYKSIKKGDKAWKELMSRGVDKPTKAALKKDFQLKEEVNEEKPGLWANIRAKRARGEKPAHGNSDAHKDAVKAGKEINKEESVCEGLYHVGYNKGRGQGTGVFKDSYSSYKDAKKAVEKLEKERGGSYNMVAYYVADKDGKFVRESVTEAKSDYEVYHKSYTSAIQAAKEYAEKKGYEINDDDSFRQIGMGPKKPSEGKTNKFSIELSKDGKVQRKKLQIQVYGMRNSYELNAYIQ